MANRDRPLLAVLIDADNIPAKFAEAILKEITSLDILNGGRFDGFVLVSSDSDFTRLASRIREDGLDVFGIGEGKAPESLRNVCNRFILIENLIDEPAAPQDATVAATKRKPQDALPMILRAMEQMNQEDDWVALGALGSTIMAAVPDFDTRTYGKRKLSELIGDIRRLETRKEGNQLMVRRRD